MKLSNIEIFSTWSDATTAASAAIGTTIEILV